MDDELLLLLFGRQNPASLLDLHWVGSVEADGVAALNDIVAMPGSAFEKYNIILSIFQGGDAS